VGTEFASRPECIRYDIAYERAAEAFSVLSRDAEREGVKIGIENVWNRFLLSPVETARLVDEVGSPFFGVYFDVGNVIYIGYPEQWIEILGKRIFKIHLSDYRYSQAGLGAFVDLFAGDVNFPAVAKALKQTGYDDWLTVEMLPNYKQFPHVSIFSSKSAVDTILELCRNA
jgi:hexulose-6-phosphate isomerase